MPDVSARTTVYDYENARPAEWPEADFIVGNPPFVGMKRMHAVLGEGYTEALRSAYRGAVPDSADYVMYWWYRAAEAVRTGRTESFGLITTNSLTQTFNRRVVEAAITADPPLALAFAVPDHPWVDSADGAAVRVAMTVGERGDAEGLLARVVSETSRGDAGAEVELATDRGRINADLTVGADVSAARPLRANEDISFWGVKFYGSGFVLTEEERDRIFGGTPSLEVIRPYVGGRDLTGKPRGQFVIDADMLGVDMLGVDEVRERYPEAYAHLLDRVKPVRDQNPRKQKRDAPGGCSERTSLRCGGPWPGSTATS